MARDRQILLALRVAVKISGVPTPGLDGQVVKTYVLQIIPRFVLVASTA